jgi:thiol-disulfide isomerase/thioredoxin
MMWRLTLPGWCVLGGALMWESALSGATVKLDVLKVGSQVYSNVTVFGANATDLYFRHDKGVNNVKLKYVDAELQKQFNYDPKAAAEAERQQAEEDARFQGSLASNLVAQAQKIARAAGSADESLADPVSGLSLLGKPGPLLRVDKWLGERPQVKGKYVLLNFWAPWSLPCKRMIPELNALQKKFADKLVVIGMASEAEAEIVAVTEPKIEFASGIDDRSKLRGALGITSIPYALLMDPKGLVRYQGHPGALTEKTLAGMLGKATE